MLTPSARRRCRQETLLLHLRELGHGSEISIQHPETDVDLSALRFRPHASRSHAPGLEQVSMQGLRQTVPKQASSRALTFWRTQLRVRRCGFFTCLVVYNPHSRRRAYPSSTSPKIPRTHRSDRTAARGQVSRQHWAVLLSRALNPAKENTYAVESLKGVYSVGLWVLKGTF